MSELVISSDIPTRTKPTMASSPVVGLTVLATGEQKTQVLDNRGNMFNAEIPAPTVAPDVITGNSAGNLPHLQWAAWCYVYAATLRYPNVENANSMGGSLAPRSNPSPITVKHVTGTGDRRADVEVTNPARADISEIWIFRTTFFDTEVLAQTAGDAGEMFYIGKVSVISFVGVTQYLDNTLADGTDQIELDNFSGPTFALVWYHDPYWFGIGNFPFEEEATWSTGGVVTLQDATKKWYNGRDGQKVYLQGLNTGSDDGLGTYYFEYLTATTAQLKLAGGSNAAIASSGSGRITIQGPPTTLYRSKLRNPFSWGETVTFGDTATPAQFVVKVGGGRATAIFSAAGLPYLVISTEGPAAMYSFDLRQAGSDFFEASKYVISQQYSVSVHWSQFAATRADGTIAMWGLDCKNFCILECDGNSIKVVSDKISKTLRLISTDPSTQLLAHGCYDAYHQINCMWFPTNNSLGLVNWLIYQHAPTGNWYFNDDKDVLCSATYQNPAQNLNLVFVGTAGGLIGQAFVAGKFWDWADNQTTLKGSMTSGTATTITMPVTTFVTSDVGLVGSWVLVTDANGEQPQWARIASASTAVLTFDLIYSFLGGSGEEFNPVPAAGFRFFIGVIEVSLLKYFNLKQPSNDKKIDEIFATLQQVDTFDSEPSTFLRFYRDRQTTPVTLEDGQQNLFLKQISTDAGLTDGWITEFPWTEEQKVFGMEILDRGHLFWQMYDYVLRGKII